MKLTDDHCVVTGAARGIGLAIAEAMLAAGARVIASDVKATALKTAVDANGSPRLHGIAADVSSASSLKTLAHEAERLFGPIELWINNAGLARHRPILQYTEDEIDLMLDVNLKRTILVSQSASRPMSPPRQAYILTILPPPTFPPLP